MTDQSDIENKIDLCEAVRRLPDRLRCVVLLQSYGYSQQEIADGLGISRRYTRDLLEKAFSFLKSTPF